MVIKHSTYVAKSGKEFLKCTTHFSSEIQPCLSRYVHIGGRLERGNKEKKYYLQDLPFMIYLQMPANS